MQSPVYSPAIPYLTSLNPIQPGMSFNVTGRSTGDRFWVDFKCGPGPTADIVFRVEPRFTHDFNVILNSRLSSNWGSEQRQPSGNPLGKGHNFTLMILVQPTSFQVAFNGQHYATFNHRLPLHRTKYLEVGGSVVVSEISQHRQTTGHQPPPPAAGPVLNPANNSPIKIPFRNIRDHTVTICGRPSQGRFGVHFFNGSNPADVYFFLNPRLGMKQVARNSCLGNMWGPEDIALTTMFPFTPGHPFQMEITVDQHCFRVTVNGSYLCDFAHRRKPLTQITHMKFTGMVNITSVAFR